MNRQSTDLLDLFRGRPSGSSSQGARAVSRPVREPGRSGGDGIPRRRLVLAGSAIGLLLVLAFVAGLRVGHSRKGAGADAPALARTAATPWILRSRNLPRIGVGMENLAARALEDLKSHYPDLAPIATIGAAPDARGGENKSHFCLVLNGFADKKRAEEWAKALAVWTVDGYIPFANARPYPLEGPK